MQMFIFIVLLFAVGFMRATPKLVSKWGKENKEIGTLVLAFILAVGFEFVLPFILNWYLNFLFDFTLSYWTAFGLLFVVSVFVEYIDVDK